jgi:hypothetical protein
VLLIGGSYACPRCLRRGPSRICDRCAKPGLNLEEPPGAALLRKALRSGELKPAGSVAAFWARRSVIARIEWLVSLLVTFVGAAVFARELHGETPSARFEPWMALLSVPVFVGFLALVRVIVLLASLLLRLWLAMVLLVVMLIAAIVDAILLKLASATRATRASARLASWLPLIFSGMTTRFALVPTTPVLGASSLSGVLDAALEATSFRGHVGDLAFSDLLPVAFDASTEQNERVHVIIDAGGLDFDEHETHRKAKRDRDPEKRASLSLSSDGPTWLRDAPAKNSHTRVARAGTPITLHGGEWSGESSRISPGEASRPDVRVLRGTAEHPLWARLG